MVERKQTPDVLAQVLGGDTASPALSLGSTVSLQRAEEGPVTWEVEIVTCQDARGWRPRFINGKELPRWIDGPLLHDYVNTRGAEGWQLAAATAMGHLYGAADSLQLWFKRPT
jgi:hypothetical protein